MFCDSGREKCRLGIWKPGLLTFMCSARDRRFEAALPFHSLQQRLICASLSSGRSAPGLLKFPTSILIGFFQ